MEKASFTPGPWNFRIGKFNGKISGNTEEGSWEDFCRVTVRMHGDVDFEPEGLANLRLITAAPELYKHLEDAVKIAENNGLSWGKSAQELLEKIKG